MGTFKRVAPIFPVRDLSASLAHYQRLGFTTREYAHHWPYSRIVSTTRVMRHIRAPRALVYRALLDPETVRQWMVPDQMRSCVHSYEAREGGTFRISLIYDLPTTAGKTSAQADSFHGRFVRLVPDTEVVQSVEFETDDPALQGEMTITYTLADAGRGTDLVGLHENLPAGVRPADNELGWSMSIDKLARLVEHDTDTGRGTR